MLIDKWAFAQELLRDKAGEGEGSSGKDEKDDSASGDSEDSEEGAEGEEEGDSSSGEEGEEGEEENKEGELTADQLKEAASLYKLLSDPVTQKDALRVLATQAGIISGDKPPETKKEATTAAKKTLEILENALGTELKWLAPKLATAFDEMREQDRESTKKELDTLKQGQVAKEVDQAYELLARETKGESRKFESKMVGLADKLYPAPGMSVQEYVRHLYTIASASGEQKSAKMRLAEKINKNSKDVPGRLTESSASGQGKGTNSNVRFSLKDAVRQAAEKQGYRGS